MITVTAAVIEKKGRILAARRKPGSHLAGCWEFPGGKLEPDETEQECLTRELREEFGIDSLVGEFLGESIYDYGSKIIRLRGYRVRHLGGTFQCRDHDQIVWLPAEELPSLHWAPADIPLMKELVEGWQIAATLDYYRVNAATYVQETIDNNAHHPIRQRFVDLLSPNSQILDLGCGSGRDSRFFLDHGHQVTAVDAVTEIAEYAEKILGRTVRVMKAEELDEEGRYDGIWACASLVHIPKSRMALIFSRILNGLKPGGIWYMSFKKGESEIQDEKQRFFNNYTIPLLQQLLLQFPGVEVTDFSESSALLRGKKQLWINVLVKKKLSVAPLE